MGETYTISYDYDGAFASGARLGVLLELPSGALFGPVGEVLTGGAVVDVQLQFSVPVQARKGEAIRLAAYRGNFNRGGRLDFTRDDFVVTVGAGSGSDPVTCLELIYYFRHDNLAGASYSRGSDSHCMRGLHGLAGRRASGGSVAG